jgi:hypothetical protein
VQKLMPPKPKNNLWGTYRNGQGQMGQDELGKFYKDLGLAPTDPLTCVLAYFSGSKEPAVWTELEFKSVCDTVKAWELQNFKAKIEGLRNEWLKNDANWKKVWAYVWKLYSGGQKYITADTFIGLTRILLENRYPLAKSFVEFFELMQEKDEKLVIYKDLWDMGLQFLMTSKADLSNINPNGNEFFLPKNRRVAVDDRGLYLLETAW